MVLDILCPPLHVPQPLGAVLLHQLPDQVLGYSIHLLRPLNIPRQNLLINDERILICERWIPGKHLINENPQGPPVHSLVVPLGLEYLWGQVLWCATQAPGLLNNFLGESKVCDDDVAISVKEDVLRLEVSVDNIEGVEVGEGTDNLCRVEEGGGGGEGSSHPEVGEELSTTDIGKHEVEVGVVFVAPG